MKIWIPIGNLSSSSAGVIFHLEICPVKRFLTISWPRWQVLLWPFHCLWQPNQVQFHCWRTKCMWCQWVIQSLFPSVIVSLFISDYFRNGVSAYFTYLWNSGEAQGRVAIDFEPVYCASCSQKGVSFMSYRWFWLALNWTIQWLFMCWSTFWIRRFFTKFSGYESYFFPGPLQRPFMSAFWTFWSMAIIIQRLSMLMNFLRDRLCWSIFWIMWFFAQFRDPVYWLASWMAPNCCIQSNTRVTSLLLYPNISLHPIHIPSLKQINSETEGLTMAALILASLDDKGANKVGKSSSCVGWLGHFELASASYLSGPNHHRSLDCSCQYLDGVIEIIVTPCWSVESMEVRDSWYCV
jgi:hypothetical protein